MTEENSSGTNTVLIVIVLLILVGFGVWWFTTHKSVAPADNGGVNIDVTLPTGQGEGGGPAQ